MLKLHTLSQVAASSNLCLFVKRVRCTAAYSSLSSTRFSVISLVAIYALPRVNEDKAGTRGQQIGDDGPLVLNRDNPLNTQYSKVHLA